jgi:hypothetical protein
MQERTSGTREDMTYDEAFRCLYGKNELVVH